jgi:hypothetical protein
VRELRTLKRTRAGSRVRSVQGRLSMELGDEDGAGGDPLKAEPSARDSGFRRPARSPGASPDKSAAGGRSPAPVFHPLAYRSVVADWPIAWREQWGRRANELEETGLSWRDAETQAFVELWHKLQREGPADQAPSVAPDSSSNDAPSSSVDVHSTVVDVTSSSVDPAHSPAD